MAKLNDESLRWDLSDLYAGATDPKLDADLSEARQRAQAFESRWRGQINAEPGIAPGDLCEAVAELEAIAELVGKAANYAQLAHAAETTSPQLGALMQSVQQRATEVQLHLIFFELEWLEVPEAVAEGILADGAVARYGHYLKAARRFKPHRLSEPEEKIIGELCNTGSRAWCRLFDEFTAAMEFKVRVNKKVRRVNESEVLAMLYEPQRERRQAGAAALTDGLQANQRLLATIFNTLLWDHEIDDRLRGYETPAASRHLDNEIDEQTVEAMLSACERAYPTVQRYYRLKGRLLGVDALMDYDRYAPIGDKASTCPYGKAREIVQSSFAQFWPQAGAIAGTFFDNRWIDVLPRPGKTGGAFCASTVPSVHPYVLCNYTNKMRDVMTVAHELGHGLHQYLARPVGYLQSHTPLTLAETASVFGEMLVFDRLMTDLGDTPEALALLCGKIEDTFATVFRQAVMTRFEQYVHEARRDQGELTVEQINALWFKANGPMHGDVVKLSDDYGWWWMYIPHFVHTPFYCYAYSFGMLLVLALYQMYKEQGSAFVPGYVSLLSFGGSQSPDALLSSIGVDIHDEGFWDRGLILVEEMVARAERLAG